MHGPSGVDSMLDEPDWVRDMFETYLDRCIAHHDMLWDMGYRSDCIYWPDDMGYKGTTFFSLETYREILKPVQKRAVEWAHNKGIKAHLHSCGNITEFLPDLAEIGIDALNPLECKAGMDALQVKKDFPFTIHGGIDAILWDDAELVVAEIERLVPKLKQGGRYIFASDHSIPNTVSLDTMRAIVAAVKKYGSYS